MSLDNQRGSITVIVIDDNDTTRAMLRGILRSAGLDVVAEAKDGKSGLERIRQLQPNLVCLDVLMPEISGIEVLKQIRQEFPEVRVLMVTGTSDRETVQAAITGGANGYLVKPFNVTKVVAAVEIALGRRIPKPD